MCWTVVAALIGILLAKHQRKRLAGGGAAVMLVLLLVVGGLVGFAYMQYVKTQKVAAAATRTEVQAKTESMVKEVVEKANEAVKPENIKKSEEHMVERDTADVKSELHKTFGGFAKNPCLLQDSDSNRGFDWSLIGKYYIGGIKGSSDAAACKRACWDNPDCAAWESCHTPSSSCFGCYHFGGAGSDIRSKVSGPGEGNYDMDAGWMDKSCTANGKTRP